MIVIIFPNDKVGISLFRLVLKETETSKNMVKENLSMEEMGFYLKNRHQYYSLKIYESENGSIWKKTLSYINGELVRNEVDSPKQEQYSTPVNISDSLEKLIQAVPYRKQNIGELLYDFIRGENVTRAKCLLQN